MTIHTRDLTRSFGSKDVLTGVDLDLGPGIHGLLGRNSVGKSSLLRILSGQLKPTFGTVEVFGVRPFDNGSHFLRRAGIGHESPAQRNGAVTSDVASYPHLASD